MKNPERRRNGEQHDGGCCVQRLVGPLPQDFRPPAYAIEHGRICITEMTVNPATQEYTVCVAVTKTNRHNLVAAVVRRKC